MSKLRHGRSLWLDRVGSGAAKRHSIFPTLAGSISADVVIVGGGITGAIAAYLFTEAGIDVVLLEAGIPANGSTAASTALLMQEPDRDFEFLARRFGARRAREIWNALSVSTRELGRTIRKLGIGCNLRRSDSVYFTTKPDKLARLEREYRRRKANGLAGRWLSAAALRRVAGVAGAGGILTPGNAAMDPIRACLGFLDAAAARGAHIFVRSTVKRVRTTEGGVLVETKNGRVVADRVLVATGYATPEFRPLLGRFRMNDTFVIATRKLPQRVQRQLPRKTVMLWDTDRPYHYVRWIDGGRLAIGGADVPHRRRRPIEKKLAEGEAKLLEYVAQVFPALAGERPEYSWAGLFAETADGLPYVGEHRLYPRHLFALGYGGNGMTASFLAAKLLLNRYLEQPDPKESLFSFRR